MNTKSGLNLQTKITNTYVDTLGGNSLVVKVSDVVNTLSCDYIYGGKTWEALGLSEAHLAAPQHEQKPFSCPHCGGNQTERRNGKTVCAYCLTEIR